MSLNIVAIQGRMVADAEMRQTTTGKAVANFRVAVDGGRKDAEPIFLNCSAWEKTAEFVNKYFPKGSQILIDGNLTCHKWQDKNGNARESVGIVARNVSFCGGKTTLPTSETPPQSKNGGNVTNPAAFDVIEDNGDLPF